MEQSSPGFVPASFEERQPALGREWMAEFQARAFSCGLSGRVFVAVFEPESRSFAVVSALDEEKLQPFLLPPLPRECLDHLDSGQEITLPGSAWPLAGERPVMMFPFLREDRLQGAVCLQFGSLGPSPEQLQVLREVCGRALAAG